MHTEPYQFEETLLLFIPFTPSSSLLIFVETPYVGIYPGINQKYSNVHHYHFHIEALLEQCLNIAPLLHHLASGIEYPAPLKMHAFTSVVFGKFSGSIHRVRAPFQSRFTMTPKRIIVTKSSRGRRPCPQRKTLPRWWRK